MHIAIFTNNYLPNPFGVSTSIESFRKEFERLGHTVYVFAPQTRGYVDQNSNVYRFPSIDFKYKISFPLAIPYSYRLDRILEKLEIDVIHSQHPNLLGWQARRWAKKKNVPLVFTWHTLYDKYAHFVPLIPSSWAASWAIKNAVAYANSVDQVVVPTLSVKKIVMDWGVENKNIEAIPTGVEEGFLENPDRSQMRKELGLAEDEIALLLVCRLSAEKNVRFLTRAVMKTLKQNEKTKFVLAGDGHELPELEKIIDEAGMSERVVFPGIVGRESIKNLYAAGDIFVYASKSETQGMIISEAMCCGLPVVALDATGIKDMVVNGETGFLVEENEEVFAAACKKLIVDEDLRKTFSQKAKKIAMENYTSSVCAQRMIKTYTDVIVRKK